jgi:hypothetical protein
MPNICESSMCVQAHSCVLTKTNSEALRQEDNASQDWTALKSLSLAGQFKSAGHDGRQSRQTAPDDATTSARSAPRH